MTENFDNSREILRPLSVGNVVSASVQLYRNRIGEYFPLAVFAYLWILVPVYGWAKFYMISALISRLAFGDLADQIETVPQARAKVKGNFWSFFGVAFQVGIRLIGVYCVGGLALAIVGGILGFILASISPILAIIAVIILYIVFLIVLLRFFSRWFIAEVPLAVEGRITGRESVRRSWNLTEKSVGRIQIIAFIGFLIALPVTAITGYLPSSLIAVLTPDIAESGASVLLTMPLSFAGAMVLLPFWQVMKSVIYYDLRSRQEGLDLELRDRPITNDTPSNENGSA